MKITFRPEFSSLPAGCESQFHLITEMAVEGTGTGQIRAPISLALIIDRSGSMTGEKMKGALDAARMVVHSLTRNDRIAVVAFDHEADLVVPLTTLSDKAGVIARLGQITSRGNTNLSGGWLLGLAELEKGMQPGQITRAILLTDGMANYGVSEPKQLEEIARIFLGKKISTSTFGFGDDFQENLLSTLAHRGGGNFYYIKGPEDLAPAFRFETGETANVVGQNVSVGFSFRDGVEVVEDLSPYRKENGTGTKAYFPGDLAEGLTLRFIHRLRVPASAARAGQPLLTTSCNFTELSGNFGVRKDAEAFRARLADDGFPPRVDDLVLDEVILAKTMAVKQEILNDLDGGNPGRALEQVGNRVRVIRDRLCAPGVIESSLLQAELRELEAIQDRVGKAQGEVKKEILMQVENYTKQRGTYLQGREEKKYALNITIPAAADGALHRMIQEVDSRLVDLGMSREFLHRTRLCLLELVSNSLEHGCRGIPRAEVSVKALFRRGAAMITVSDPGNGFDVDAVLQNARGIVPLPGNGASSDNAQTSEHGGGNDGIYLGERGRGLGLVLALADEVQFTGGGREAMVRLSHRVREGILSPDNMSVSQPVVGKSLEARVSNHAVSGRNVVQIEWNGEVGTETQTFFKDRIDGILAEGVKDLIIDLADVCYLNSMGLGVLAATLKKIQKSGGRMVISRLSPSVEELFQLTRINRVFNIRSSNEEALEFFRMSA